MRKITTFTLNGKPVALKRRGTIPEAIKRALDKWPTGKFLTTVALAKLVGCSPSSTPPAEQMPGYAVVIGGIIHWGSRRTIQQAEDILDSND